MRPVQYVRGGRLFSWRICSRCSGSDAAGPDAADSLNLYAGSGVGRRDSGVYSRKDEGFLRCQRVCLLADAQLYRVLGSHVLAARCMRRPGVCQCDALSRGLYETALPQRGNSVILLRADCAGRGDSGRRVPVFHQMGLRNPYNGRQSALCGIQRHSNKTYHRLLPDHRRDDRGLRRRGTAAGQLLPLYLDVIAQLRL